MMELLVLFLVVAAAGGIAVILSGMLIGIVVAVAVGILLTGLAILGFVGKIVLLPLTATLWVATHPLLALLLIGLAVLLLRGRQGTAIHKL